MIDQIIKLILIIIVVIVIYNIINMYCQKEAFAISVKQMDNLELNVGSNQKIFTNYDQPMKDIAGAIPLDFDYKSYYETTADEGKNLVYYYNDAIDQSKISETAYNVVNQIDPIDFSNVETGLDKCKKNCKGVCFEGGYTGVATCYPMEQKTFDWGTLYKNPTFTYGYTAFDNNDDIQNP
jgi:hypothetical protein